MYNPLTQCDDGQSEGGWAGGEGVLVEVGKGRENEDIGTSVNNKNKKK